MVPTVRPARATDLPTLAAIRDDVGATGWIGVAFSEYRAR